MTDVKISKDIQQGKVLVAFPYDSKFVAKVKSIDGHRWHPDKKYWSFPYSEDIFTKLPSVTSFIRKTLGETAGLIERGGYNG